MEIETSENSVAFSVEVESRAMAGACYELTWLRYLHRNLRVLSLIVILQQQNCIAHCSKPSPSWATREMDCYYIRDKIQDGFVATRSVNYAHQLEDVLTKALGKELFTPMIRKLGL